MWATPYRGITGTAPVAQASVAESSVVLRLYREHIMTTSKIPLKVVIAPAVGVVLAAPPVLMASEHSVDYTCRRPTAR
jgi:hypothetical protein